MPARQITRMDNGDKILKRGEQLRGCVAESVEAWKSFPQDLPVLVHNTSRSRGLCRPQAARTNWMQLSRTRKLGVIGGQQLRLCHVRRTAEGSEPAATAGGPVEHAVIFRHARALPSSITVPWVGFLTCVQLDKSSMTRCPGPPPGHFHSLEHNSIMLCGTNSSSNAQLNRRALPPFVRV